MDPKFADSQYSSDPGKIVRQYEPRQSNDRAFRPSQIQGNIIPGQPGSTGETQLTHSRDGFVLDLEWGGIRPARPEERGR
jgi:hypothetical protein